MLAAPRIFRPKRQATMDLVWDERYVLSTAPQAIETHRNPGEVDSGSDHRVKPRVRGLIGREPHIDGACNYQQRKDRCDNAPHDLGPTQPYERRVQLFLEEKVSFSSSRCRAEGDERADSMAFTEAFMISR